VVVLENLASKGENAGLKDLLKDLRQRRNGRLAAPERLAEQKVGDRGRVLGKIPLDNHQAAQVPPTLYAVGRPARKLGTSLVPPYKLLLGLRAEVIKDAVAKRSDPTPHSWQVGVGKRGNDRNAGRRIQHSESQPFHTWRFDSDGLAFSVWTTNVGID